MRAVGIMSGTSLDGVDVVLCTIQETSSGVAVTEDSFLTVEIPNTIKEKIERAMTSNQLNAAFFTSLNVELGELFADSVCQLCQHAGIKTNELDFIASHGQTIYHIPRKTEEYVASTWQMGEPAIIAYRCGCPVISNFRTMDMAAGGEGAPLVPYSEYILYRHPEKTRALQNLGGIGNVTLIPKDKGMDEVMAFDTGPANMMINEAMEYFYQLPFDKDGQVAASGTLITAMCEELKQHPYLKKVPPKSTGREEFGVPYTRELIKKYKNEKPEDIVATLTWFTAYSIAVNYQQFIMNHEQIDEVILGGGGAHNLCIREYLKKLLPDVAIRTQEELGYSSDSKEAIAFAILGYETLHKRPSNVPSATGALRPVILGQITVPYE